MSERGANHRQDRPPLTPGRVAVGVTLTAIGGYVDCFGYLTLSQVYTAQMSGNTVLIATRAGSSEPGSALLHAYTIAVFVFGLLVSGIGIEVALRRAFRRVLALALTIEVACLAAIALWGAPLIEGDTLGPADAPHWTLYALIALTAAAMGTQNTTLRMAGILAVFTTHVTGTLAHASEWLVLFLLPRAGTRRRPALAQAAFSVALWLAFFLGALLAAELRPRREPGVVLLLPMAALLFIIAADLVRPFADAK